MALGAPVTLPYHEWTTPEVEASYEGPGPQRRLTIAFRIILAVPHLIYVFFVMIAALAATVAGWFAALALGRLPDGLADFLARAVQYAARVNAYSYLLLTDRYPPFDLGRAEYAVSFDIPRGLRLNRAAVLFRIVLLIPAMIVVQLIGYGLFVVVLVAWLLALMLGRLPLPLFGAFAAVLRYETRFYAYAAMLTSEYPRGLFGDPAGAPYPSYPPPYAAAETVPPPAPFGDRPGAAYPPYPPSPPPYAAPEAEPPGPWSASVPPPPPPPVVAAPGPRIRTLLLPRSAKVIIGVILALGVVFGVASNIWGPTDPSSDTADRLEASYLLLSDDMQRYASQSQRCVFSGGIECLQEANGQLADDVRRFQRELRTIEFTDAAIDQAEQLDADATALILKLERMASTNEQARYDELLAEFQSLAVIFDDDFQQLMDQVEVAF
jgi:Domain of unknown function (DUF4389)